MTMDIICSKPKYFFRKNYKTQVKQLLCIVNYQQNLTEVGSYNQKDCKVRVQC